MLKTLTSTMKSWFITESQKKWHSILNSLYHKVILHTFFSGTANRSYFPCFPDVENVVLEADAMKTSTWSMVLLAFLIININKLVGSFNPSEKY